MLSFAFTFLRGWNVQFRLEVTESLYDTGIQWVFKVASEWCTCRVWGQCFQPNFYYFVIFLLGENLNFFNFFLTFFLSIDVNNSSRIGSISLNLVMTGFLKQVEKLKFSNFSIQIEFSITAELLHQYLVSESILYK